MKDKTDAERFKMGLELNNLISKEPKTTEEQERLKQLLLMALDDLNNDKALCDEYDAADDFPDDYPNSDDQSTVSIPAPTTPQAMPRPAPQVPTVAADITNLAKAGVVNTKRIINEECPGLGGQRTPLQKYSVTSSQKFALSPGLTTGTFERTVTVVVKKPSGEPFHPSGKPFHSSASPE